MMLQRKGPLRANIQILFAYIELIIKGNSAQECLLAEYQLP